VISSPLHYKPFPFLLRPQGIVVVIDSDMILTRNLTPVLALAAEGRICTFPDPEKDRRFPEWREIFGLPSAMRKQTYVCSGSIGSAAHTQLPMQRATAPDSARKWFAQTLGGHRRSGNCLYALPSPVAKLPRSKYLNIQ
jgi:hypothetical protein